MQITTDFYNWLINDWLINDLLSDIVCYLWYGRIFADVIVYIFAH